MIDTSEVAKCKSNASYALTVNTQKNRKEHTANCLQSGSKCLIVYFLALQSQILCILNLLRQSNCIAVQLRQNEETWV